MVEAIIIILKTTTTIIILILLAATMTIVTMMRIAHAGRETCHNERERVDARQKCVKDKEQKVFVIANADAVTVRNGVE